MMIVLAILLGGFFGFALYKVGAANMDNLISMLSFQNLTLMKIIVFAIGLASVLLSIFYGFGWYISLSINTLNSISKFSSIVASISIYYSIYAKVGENNETICISSKTG